MQEKYSRTGEFFGTFCDVGTPDLLLINHVLFVLRALRIIVVGMWFSIYTDLTASLVPNYLNFCDVPQW